MPTKQEYLDALSIEYVKGEFEISKRQWLKELEEATYAEVRYYYHYYRRAGSNFLGHTNKTMVRGNRIVRMDGSPLN